MKSIQPAITTAEGHKLGSEAAVARGGARGAGQLWEAVEFDACKQLWVAVLEQAVKDARGSRRYHSIVMEAREWFRSQDEDPGSFLWVCRILRLDAEVVRGAVEKEYYYEAA